MTMKYMIFMNYKEFTFWGGVATLCAHFFVVFIKLLWVDVV